MLERRRLIHWVLFVALVVFWGASFSMTRVAVQTLSPEWTVAFRIGIAALLLFIYARYKQISIPVDALHLRWYGWLGLTGSLFPYIMISWGSQYISSGVAGILMAIVPLIVVVMAHFLLPDEKLTSQKLTGFLIGFAGLVILMSPDLAVKTPFGWRTLLAQLAILLAATSYATQAVTSRLSPPLSWQQKTIGTSYVAALGALTIALLENPFGWQALTGESLVMVTGLAIFPTALAAAILFYLLEKAGAGFVAMSNYLISPFAFLVGMLFLGEEFYWQAGVGLAVILFGIAWSEKKK